MQVGGGGGGGQGGLRVTAQEVAYPADAETMTKMLLPYTLVGFVT